MNTPEINALVTKPKANEFQEYKSARSAMRMVTPSGIRIPFTSFTYLTQNPEVIAYLDEQIAKEVPGVVKGALKTSEDLDPNAAIRKKHFEEFEAARLKGIVDDAAGKSRDMGTTEAPKLNPSSTKTVAN